MKNIMRQTTYSYHYTLAPVKLLAQKKADSKVIGTIPAGVKVEIVDGFEKWYEIRYQNLQGYVAAADLSKTKYTWRDSLLRPYPTAEANPAAVIPAQTAVEVLSVTGDWSHVIYNEQKGYIFSYFLTDDGNPPDQYDYTYFYTDMLRFVNDNAIKSPTVNLITTDLENKLTYLFKKTENMKWELLYKWSCTVGKPSTPTIQGTFYVTGRKPYFGTENYRVKYATRIKGSYYYHSVLFNAAGTQIINDILGVAASHGCIRLAVPDAQWLYDNVLDASAIVIH